MPQAADDHDSPWKEALEHFFSQCLALFAAELHALIDWSYPPQFLDKELQAISVPTATAAQLHEAASSEPDQAIASSRRSAITGQGRAHRASTHPDRRYADKLVQVMCLDGRHAIILVHIEVQGGSASALAQTVFAKRMYQYRYRLDDRYGRRPMQSHVARESARNDLPRSSTVLGTPRAGHPSQATNAHYLQPAIYSLGILTTSRAGKPYLTYSDQFLGQGVQFTFPIIHMAQWLDRWKELEALAQHNPFAIVIMAQLTALRWPRKAARLSPKVELMRQLYGYGYDQAIIHQLFRLIDWMIRLPEGLEQHYTQALQSLEQEHAMTYITTPERVGLRRGRLEGRAEGRVEGQADLLLRQIARRFGTVSDEITERIRSATAAQLETWSLNFVDATNLDDVFRA